MSHFNSKFAGWMFGLACIASLGIVVLNEVTFVKAQDAIDETTETASDDLASAEIDQTDSDINQLKRELKRLKTSVAVLEKKIATVQDRQEENRKLLARQSQRRPVRGNEPAPAVLKTNADFSRETSDALAAPLYTRSPLAQLNAMTADIDARIAELRKRGDTDLAKDTAALLKQLNRQRSGKYPVVSETPEIHMIGLYEASSSHHAIAPAKVQVTYSGAPIILALTSYEPVEWHIEASPDVQIDQVIVSGYYEQRVKGLPDSVPVWEESRDNGGQAFYSYKRGDSSFRKAVNRLHELTGRGVLTFQGTYRYPGKPFVVGPESSDWRTQHLVTRMAPLHAHATAEENENARANAQKIVFEGVYVSGADQRGHGGKASWGQFTANGPIMDTLVALPHNYKHVVTDPDSGLWYGLNGGDVVRFKLDGERPVALPIPFGLPRLSWPCGLTFDSKRGRLLLSSLGGEGFLYAYDVDAESWSVVTSMKGADTTGLTWSREEDCLYALSIDHGDRSKNSLVKLTADGVLTETVQLGDELPNLGHHPRCQLIPVNEKIVLLAPGEPVEDRHDGPATHSYVIAPKTGSIEYSTKLDPQ